MIAVAIDLTMTMERFVLRPDLHQSPLIREITDGHNFGVVVLDRCVPISTAARGGGEVSAMHGDLVQREGVALA